MLGGIAGYKYKNVKSKRFASTSLRLVFWGFISAFWTEIAKSWERFEVETVETMILRTLLRIKRKCRSMKPWIFLILALKVTMLTKCEPGNIISGQVEQTLSRLRLLFFNALLTRIMVFKASKGYHYQHADMKSASDTRYTIDCVHKGV